MARDLADGSAPGWHLNFLCRRERACHERQLSGNSMEIISRLPLVAASGEGRVERAVGPDALLLY
jgi:hypothetical protein